MLADPWSVTKTIAFLQEIAIVAKVQLSNDSEFFVLYYNSFFKNTSYLLVKIAHRFLLENSQNYVVPRGGRLGSYPLVSYASPRGSVAMAISQRAHWRFLAHAAKTHLFGLEIFAIDITSVARGGRGGGPPRAALFILLLVISQNRLQGNRTVCENFRY